MERPLYQLVQSFEHTHTPIPPLHPPPPTGVWPQGSGQCWSGGDSSTGVSLHTGCGHGNLVQWTTCDVHHCQRWSVPSGTEWFTQDLPHPHTCYHVTGGHGSTYTLREVLDSHIHSCNSFHSTVVYQIITVSRVQLVHHCPLSSPPPPTHTPGTVGCCGDSGGGHLQSGEWIQCSTVPVLFPCLHQCLHSEGHPQGRQETIPRELSNPPLKFLLSRVHPHMHPPTHLHPHPHTHRHGSFSPPTHTHTHTPTHAQAWFIFPVAGFAILLSVFLVIFPLVRKPTPSVTAFGVVLSGLLVYPVFIASTPWKGYLTTISGELVTQSVRSLPPCTACRSHD